MTADAPAGHVEIYTDGGCDPNPGPGGWGAILIAGPHIKELSGAEPQTTNNRMELTAAVSALRALKRPCDVDLYTDSQYLRRGITEWLPAWQSRGWRRADGKPVENVDLWQELAREAERHRIAWRWVKGHRGNPLNERADQLATEARQRLLSSKGRAHEPAKPPTPTVTPQKDALPEIRLYARGSALGPGSGPGGYAALLVDVSGKELKAVSGGWPLASSNVMDLWAVVAGLRALTAPSRVTIYTPSSYVVDGATRWLAAWERRNWQTQEGQPVKHKEIWLELSHVMGDHNVTWESAAGDANEYSRRAAQLAREEAEKMRSAAP